MSDIVIVQILDEILDMLNATGRPADVPEVTLRRTFPDEEVKEARMAIYLGDETVDPPRQNSSQDPLARRRTSLAVQCVAATDDPSEIDFVTQPMVAWATEVLGMTKIPELGLHYAREQSTVRRVASLGHYVVVTTVIFELSYQTRRNDLTRIN